MTKKKETLEETINDTLIPLDEQPYRIPGNWVWTKLGVANEIITGNTPSKKRPEFYGEYLPFVKPNDLDQGRNLKFSTEYLSKEGARVARVVKAGSTAICCIGSIGKSAFLEIDVATNQQINTVVPINEIVNLYTYYYSLSSEFQNLLNSNSSATTISIINKTKVSRLPYPLPPLPEQQRLVDRIESLFEKIDKAQALIEETHEGFEKRKEAILAKAFRGELTEKWREENNLSIDNWEKGPIKEYISKLNQGWSPKCESFPSTDKNKWGVIKTTAIQHMNYNETENKQLPINLKPKEQHELKKNDILVTRAGPRIRVGVCCLIKDTRPKLLLCDKAYRFNAHEDKVLPEYLAMFLNSPDKLHEINKMKTGISDSGVNITQKGFLGLEIQVPSIVEQQKIVDTLNNILNNEKKINSLCEMLDEVEFLKKSILAKAFRGELGTNDPSEESAITLLEEIITSN